MDYKVYEKLPQTQVSLSHILHHYLNFRQSVALKDTPKPFFVGLSGSQGSGMSFLYVYRESAIQFIHHYYHY